jgi:hypothetical protein
VVLVGVTMTMMEMVIFHLKMMMIQITKLKKMILMEVKNQVMVVEMLLMIEIIGKRMRS